MKDFLFKIARITFLLGIVFISQEQFFFEYFTEKGIFITHFFSTIAIIMAFLYFLKEKKDFEMSQLHLASLVFLGGVFLTTFFSANFIESQKYLFFIVFGVLYFFSFSSVFKQNDIFYLIRILAISLNITFFTGIYDILAFKCHWPVLNTKGEPNHFISGFHYFGNTADFAQIILSIIIPFWFVNRRQMKFIEDVYFFMTIILGIVLLFGTLRVSVIISFCFGLLIWFIFNLRTINKKFYFFVLPTISTCLFLLFYEFPNLLSGLLYRFNSRILNRNSNTLEGDFFINNIKSAIQIFLDNPLFGKGLGQAKILVLDQVFYIHGTFFMLLGDTGIIGTLGYILLIVVIYRIFLRYYFIEKNKNLYYQFFPFLIGIFVSSIYNILFFRIEFWILITFCYLFMKLSKNQSNS